MHVDFFACNLALNSFVSSFLFQFAILVSLFDEIACSITSINIIGYFASQNYIRRSNEGIFNENKFCGIVNTRHFHIVIYSI